MRRTMKEILRNLSLAALIAMLGGCERQHAPSAPDQEHGQGHAATDQPAKGPNGGRLLVDGDFAVELAIFETGVPPEYRAWVTAQGKPVDAGAVDLAVTLRRLGDVTDVIAFAPRGDFLRGDSVVYEPHSFVVTVEAQYRGERHRWQYDSFEGRTRLEPEVAAAFGLETDIAGPATIRETVLAYGRVAAIPERVSEVRARFEGMVRTVTAEVGDTVRAGQALATVESNESLQSYTITAPIGGHIIQRAANPAEATGGRLLFTILDTSTVWAELAVFPQDRGRVRVGTAVTIRALDGGDAMKSAVSSLGAVAEPDQSVLARAVLENPEGALVPGMHVTAEFAVAEHAVPLAVKRVGLQSFRDFTVVYAQVGDEYEVRMLDLGRQDREWIEVLGGLAPGTRYVTTNSYLVKADIEKSGASHDH